MSGEGTITFLLYTEHLGMITGLKAYIAHMVGLLIVFLIFSGMGIRSFFEGWKEGTGK